MNSTKDFNQIMNATMDQEERDILNHEKEDAMDREMNQEMDQEMNQNQATMEAEAEEEEKKKGFPLIWLVVLFLFILVLMTTILVTSYIKEQASRDKNVIHLVPEGQVVEQDNAGSGNGDDSQEGTGSDTSQKGGTGSERDTASTETKSIPVLPGFEGSDLEGLWRNQTTVDIFKDFYNEQTGIWTVWSNDGDKVIAPGTGNVYAFQLKNTGNISMDYILTIESKFEMGDVRVPIEVRLKTADGVYIAGDENTWLTPEELNEVVETGRLDVNHYANYRLEWQWPFHPEYATEGWDINDTMVGNKAVYEDLNFTMQINTTATTTPGAKPVAGYWLNGQYIPKTGDRSNFLPYIIGFAAAAGVLLFVFVSKRRYVHKKETCNDERQP